MTWKRVARFVSDLPIIWGNARAIGIWANNVVRNHQGGGKCSR